MNQSDTERRLELAKVVHAFVGTVLEFDGGKYSKDDLRLCFQAWNETELASSEPPELGCSLGSCVSPKDCTRKCQAMQMKLDAHCWRWWKRDLVDFVWMPEHHHRSPGVRWSRFVPMPEPDISKEGLAKAGGVQQLENWILTQRSPE